MSLTAPFVLVKFLFDIQIKFSRCFTPGLMMDWNLHDELFRISHSFFFFTKLNALLACFIASLECLYSAHISCEEWQDQFLLRTQPTEVSVCWI